jgi:signal transduction histidine kinase
MQKGKRGDSEVIVESQPDKGSIFAFFLPLTAGSATMIF